MLSPEELMKPRFKAIADYPHSPYKIGDVIDFGDGYSTKKMTETPYNDPWGEINYASNHYDEDEFRKYPALFQPLPWYADRKPEDMPEYVRFGESEMRHTVYKIKEWHLNGIYGIETVCAIAEEPKDYLLIFGAGKCYPNTEAEFLTYKNKNNG